jgi:hypothetical protein
MEKVLHAIRSKILRDEKSLRVAGAAPGLVLPEGRPCGVLPPARAKSRSFTIRGSLAPGQRVATGLMRLAVTVGLLVLTLSGDRISAMTRFDSGALDGFGLPLTVAR